MLRANSTIGAGDSRTRSGVRWRAARPPDHEAKQRCYDDRHDRHEQRVDDPDPEEAEITVELRRVAGELERYLDASAAPQEIEAGRDAGLDHILRGVVDEIDDETSTSPPATAAWAMIPRILRSRSEGREASSCRHYPFALPLGEQGGLRASEGRMRGASRSPLIRHRFAATPSPARGRRCVVVDVCEQGGQRL